VLIINKDNRMKNTTTISVHMLFAAVIYSSSLMADDGSMKDAIAHGEQAHSEHCVKCHTDSVYTREDRRVKSIDALGKQVRRCRDNLDISWFDEDTDAVVQFLNQKYNKF
jgi:hypothetical protein